MPQKPAASPWVDIPAPSGWEDIAPPTSAAPAQKPRTKIGQFADTVLADNPALPPQQRFGQWLMRTAKDHPVAAGAMAAGVAAAPFTAGASTWPALAATMAMEGGAQGMGALVGHGAKSAMSGELPSADEVKGDVGTAALFGLAGPVVGKTIGAAYRGAKVIAPTVAKAVLRRVPGVGELMDAAETVKATLPEFREWLATRGAAKAADAGLPTPPPSPVTAPQSPPLPASLGPQAYTPPPGALVDRAGFPVQASPAAKAAASTADATLETRDPIAAWKQMVAENPQIEQQAAELQARAAQSRLPAPPRGGPQMPSTGGGMTPEQQAAELAFKRSLLAANAAQTGPSTLESWLAAGRTPAKVMAKTGAPVSTKATARETAAAELARRLGTPATTDLPLTEIEGSKLAAAYLKELRTRGTSPAQAIKAVRANPDLAPEMKALIIDRLKVLVK